MKLNRKIVTFIFLFVLLTPIVLYSQENYIKGRIIKQNNDTINGFIDYQNWEINPDKISFKRKLTENKTEFKALDIKEFDVNNEIYESGLIQIETSSNLTNELSTSFAMDFEEHTAFLQAYMRGNKSLYLYKTKKQKEQFYIKNDSKFELLEYKKYIRTREDEEVVISENKKYVGQLMLYLSDCEALIPKIQTTRYTLKDLTNLFNNYDSKVQLKSVYKKEPDKVKSEFGVAVGGTLSNLYFYGWYNEALINTAYPSSKDFTAALFYNMVFPRNRGKWSIHNELMYNMYSFSGQSLNYTSDNQYSIYSSYLSYSYIKMNNLVRYNFILKNINIFLNAGISNGLVLSENKNNLITETKFYTSNTLEEKRALKEIRTYEQGLLWGAGISFKKYSVELRLEQANGMSTYIGLHGNVDRYLVLFAYKF
jgi:hypothetical protein